MEADLHVHQEDRQGHGRELKHLVESQHEVDLKKSVVEGLQRVQRLAPHLEGLVRQHRNQHDSVEVHFGLFGFLVVAVANYEDCAAQHLMDQRQRIVRLFKELLGQYVTQNGCDAQEHESNRIMDVLDPFKTLDRDT